MPPCSTQPFSPQGLPGFTKFNKTGEAAAAQNTKKEAPIVVANAIAPLVQFLPSSAPMAQLIGEGYAVASDNQIDSATGTIKVRAAFEK